MVPIPHCKWTHDKLSTWVFALRTWKNIKSIVCHTGLLIIIDFVTYYKKWILWQQNNFHLFKHVYKYSISMQVLYMSLSCWKQQNYMMTSSHGSIFRVTGPYERNSPHKGQNFDVSSIRALNKRLSKQSWRRWFETPSCSLWRHCHACSQMYNQVCKGATMPCVIW